MIHTISCETVCSQTNYRNPQNGLKGWDQISPTTAQTNLNNKENLFLKSLEEALKHQKEALPNFKHTCKAQ